MKIDSIPQTYFIAWEWYVPPTLRRAANWIPLHDDCPWLLSLEEVAEEIANSSSAQFHVIKVEDGRVQDVTDAAHKLVDDAKGPYFVKEDY